MGVSKDRAESAVGQAWAPSTQLHDLLHEYAAVMANYHATGVDTTRDPADKENQGAEAWRAYHYLNVGADAVGLVVRALIQAGRRPPKRILDFPCGSGRVLRHLAAMFPDAEIGACDLYREHVDFCAEQFGAIPLMSKENLDDLDVGADWDVIFCGSLLTHLPEHLFWPTMRFMARSLSPTGIALVTLEGRHAEYIQDHKWKLIDDERFEVVRTGFHEKGFGFVDYTADFRTAFHEQASYGVTLVTPQWVTAGLLDIPGIRMFGYQERAWDDHQDVIVFGRPDVNA